MLSEEDKRAHRLISNKKYYETHKQQSLEYSRLPERKHKKAESDKKYSLIHKEQKAETGRNYRNLHREEVKFQKQKYINDGS